jgi:hypothetical protein
MSNNSTYTRTSSSHIYKTESGSYRFRKSINGKKISKNFSRLKDAREFKKEVEQEWV